MRNVATLLLGAALATALLAPSGARAWTDRDDLLTGALAGAAAGALAGSVFGPPPPPATVYRARPAWSRPLPPHRVIEVYRPDPWDEDDDEDWDD
jgi:hypothetical protein